MKPKKYKVMIDIYKGVLNNQLIEFTTQDHGSNVLEFEILEDKVTPYNLDGCLVRMVINGQQQDCTIADATNGLVNITLHQSMFSEVGPVFAELQIYDALNQTIRLTTPIFKYTVKKSLMDDETVQADPNYSILQNMILEVSSADEVAKQAKKTAESAMATANQAESKANQIMSNGDYAKEQGDYAKAEGDRLQGMLTLGGAPQTKFDFIKNKVVQDGLVNLVIDKGGVTSNVEFKQDKEFSISVYAQHSVGTSGNKNIVGVQSVYQQYGWFLAMKGDTGNIQLISNTDGKEMSVMVGNVSDGAFHRYDLIYKNHKIAISIDGVFMGIYDLIFTDGGDKRIKTGANSQGQPLNMYKYFYIYDRELFSQEIERNFSVLNNVPSIKELHTTDSTGKTSILKLASDEDHVEMASGRTLREEYMGVLKAMGKEVPSADGSPVKVPNGIEARVINAEIKGQTVKNEFYALPNNIRFSNGMMVLSGSISGVQQQQKESTFNKCIGILKPNTVYSVVLDVIETNYTQTMVFGVGNTVDIDVSTTGIKVGKFTTPSSVTGDTLITLQNKVADQLAGRKIAFKFGFYEGDLTIKNPIKSPKFGLSSTQAIISNNCEPYPIYANEEDETNKKVILLNGFNDIYDTFEIKEDGSGLMTKKFMIIDDSLIDKWIISSQGDPSVNRWQLETDFYKLYPAKCTSLSSISNILASTLNAGSFNSAQVKAGIVYAHTNKTIGVSTEKTISSIEQFKEWFRGQLIIYELDIPIVTHIAKEIMPSILTHKTNILEAGGAVKPSSFKVTVPVDKLAEIEARLQALESTTVDVVLNK